MISYGRWMLALATACLVCSSALAWPYSPPSDFTNADFETLPTTQIPGWTYYAMSMTDSVSIYESDGNYYAGLFAMAEEMLDMPGEIMPGYTELGQSIDVPTDATSLVFDYQGQATWGRIYVTISGQGFHDEVDLVGTSDWTALEVALPDESRGVNTGIVFRAVTDEGCLGNADLWLDNVHIVPEPTTISLLALGSLALIRRRRSRRTV